MWRAPLSATRRSECRHVGTEALLFGLLREDEGLAARVLESFGVTLERAGTEGYGIGLDSIHATG